MEFSDNILDALKSNTKGSLTTTGDNKHGRSKSIMLIRRT